MIARKGIDNILAASHFVGVDGSLNLAEYRVKCVVTDISGKEMCVRDNGDVVRGDDNCVASIIPASVMKRWTVGTYFLSFELWRGEEKVMSNEVEQVDLI